MFENLNNLEKFEHYKFEQGVVILGDCVEVLRELKCEFDLNITDLPYGTTRCKWDSIIGFDELWEVSRNSIKNGNAICFNSTQPFTTLLIHSNLEEFSYIWNWDKKFAGNFVQAKRMPLKVVEDVCVFSKNKKTPRYFPQMLKRDKPIYKGGNKQSEAIPIAITENSEKFGNSKKEYTEKFPTDLISFNVREGRGLHPTQKPVALNEYLIKTYSLEGETVLDMCAGSGTTLIAALRTNRKFVGVEKDPKYYSDIIKRIQNENSNNSSKTQEGC